MCESKARLDGKVIIVTGGSSGVGFEAAKDLAYRGARVIIASRNETKLKRARDDIKETTNNPYVKYKILDLASLKSVRHFANDVVNSEERLDVLINNAGAVGLPDKLTEDGLSLTMQVNFFGTFLLTYLLLPLLKASAPSRIINSSAGAMFVGEIDLDHWNEIGRYSSISALGNSKLAMELFTAELSRRLDGTSVTANSFDPFLVGETDITSNIPGIIRNVAQMLLNIVGRPKEDVGKEISNLAANPDLRKVNGKHYKFCREWMNHWLVQDKEISRKLWNVSKRLVKIRGEEDFLNNNV